MADLNGGLLWNATKEDIPETENEKNKVYVTKFGFDGSSGKWDLVMKVDDIRVHVLGVVLEMCSPVFEEIIQAIKDSEGKKNELVIKDTKCKDFVDFLTCFYPGKSHQLTSESVFRILPLACTYKVEQVKGQCEQYLLMLVESDKTSRHLLVRSMDAAYDQDLKRVKEVSRKRLVEMELQEDKIPYTVPSVHRNNAKTMPCNLNARIDLYEQYIPSLKRAYIELQSVVIRKDGEIKERDRTIQMYQSTPYR